MDDTDLDAGMTEEAAREPQPEPAAEPIPEAAFVAPAMPDLAAAVEQWWADHFPGSPVARVTEAWNHAFAAKEELKRRLADLLGGGH